MEKESEEKIVEEKNNIDKINTEINNDEKEKQKEINDLNFDNLEKSQNYEDKEKISNINNLQNFVSEKEQNNEINKNIINPNQKIKDNPEFDIPEEKRIKDNYNENIHFDKNYNENENEKKEINKDFEYPINIEDKNSSEKKNAFVQTNNIDNEELKEKDNSNINKKQELYLNNVKLEMKNENKDFFEQKLKSGNQTLESDGNPNNKKVRRNKNYNQKILNNKNIIIQEQESNEKNKGNKEEKQQKKIYKKNLNQLLLEKEMNAIKKRLEQKQNQKKKKESDKLFGDFKKLKNINLKNQNIIKIIGINEKLSSRRSQISDEKGDNFNTPSKNDICSQFLKAAMENEKQLYLVPYAKQKEKIKKTFNAIGNSNGIIYSEYRVIKGIENDNKNIFNIIRDDDRKSLSKRKDYSDISPSKRSNYYNQNRFIDTNSEFKS